MNLSALSGPPQLCQSVSVAVYVFCWFGVFFWVVRPVCSQIRHTFNPFPEENLSFFKRLLQKVSAVPFHIVFFGLPYKSRPRPGLLPVHMENWPTAPRGHFSGDGHIYIGGNLFFLSEGGCVFKRCDAVDPAALFLTRVCLSPPPPPPSLFCVPLCSHQLCVFAFN